MKSTVVFTVIAHMIVGSAAWAHEPVEKPLIRIETGSHTSDITGLSVDRGGQLIATSSYDKTLRLWQLSANSGPRTIIRAPIDFDREGTLYTVALSPSSQEAVAAGWTGGWDKNGFWSLYVFEPATGTMKRRIADLKGRVVSLRYSATGDVLAVGLKETPGVLLFETKNWTVIGQDSQDDDIPSIDVDGAGNVVAASLSGSVSLYGPGLTNKRTISAPGGSPVAIVRFSPDGSTIAVGYLGSARIDFLSSTDLGKIGSAETDGSEGDFIALAWSKNGEYLYGGGHYQRNGRYPIRRWSKGGRGPAQDSSHALAAVTRLEALPDDRIAFTTQGGTIGILNRSLQLIWERRPQTADFRNQASTLRISHDGRTVDFAYDRLGDTPMRFSLETKSLSAGDPSDTALTSALTAADGIDLRGWSNSRNPTLNGTRLQLRPHEEALSAAIAPDRSSFVLGTAWRLICYDANGQLLWALDAPGQTWAVNVTGNGSMAVAAFSDGTIRWFRLTDGKPLLAFFTQSSTRSWVAWTPSGYYAASTGGDRLIGWHLNRGRDQAADFFSVGRFRDTFYRPDVVERILTTLDEDLAIIRKGDSGPGANKVRDVAQLLPPVVTFEPGPGATSIRTPHVRIAYNIRLPGGDRAKVLELRADGSPIAVLSAGAQPIPERGELDVYLPRRDTTIELIAQSANGTWSESAVRQLQWKGTPDQVKPALFILAIGISDYRVDKLKLKLAAKDADDFGKVFRSQGGGQYRSVELLALKDVDASGARVRQALDWLSSKPSSRDIAILFMAGHGGDDANGEYFFAPHEVDPAHAEKSGIFYREIRAALERIAGRRFFFLDTCHSGAAWGLAPASVADIGRIVNDLASPEYGIMTFASSTDRQLSFELEEWGNGAFTKAVLEGLSGKADLFGNGYVTTNGLAAYVSDRVGKLTNGFQTPATGRPMASDFTLFSLR